MALLNSELERIKLELGFNTLTVGAEPYVGFSAIFSQVIQPYLSAGTSTTSSTSVTAATSPTPVTLTLGSVTGVATFARLIVEVPARKEEATVQVVSGSTVTVLLSLAHSGTYPVTVEGGESIVRGLLKRCRAVQQAIDDAVSGAGIKKVDEIEFFGDGKAKSSFETLCAQQTYWRSELCRALFGVGDIRQLGRGGRATSRTELY